MTPALIGRERSAESIRAEVARALDSHGGLVLVAGEAGVGKTALVTQTLNDAGTRGAVVASGACWDREGAPGYWPWVQVVRQLERVLEPAEWSEAADAAGDGLTFLLGDFSEPPAMSDLDNAAFRLCDAVTTLLVTIARRRPVIIALDDLHWADASSLRMLDFVVRHTWFERVLVVGTYRDVEIDSSQHPVRDLLRDLEMRATTVTLTGLDQPAVGTLIAQTTGREPDQEFVAEIHRRTGGNPLFVEQLARLWQVSGPTDAAAPGIRAAVDRHLSHLPRSILGVLTDAAVLGPEFHRQVLASVTGSPASEVHQLLHQAAATRLVVPLDAGRFRFSHDLVREALYDSLDEDQRRRRHAAATRALREDRPGEYIAPSHLAHHAYLAVPEVSAAEAVRHLVAAGREAACRLASEEAGTHFRRALELAPDDQPHQRATIMLSLGDQQRRAGQRQATRQTLDSAVALSEEAGDTELLARARTARAQLDQTGEEGGAPGVAGAHTNGGGTNVFRHDGIVWTLTFAGRTVHVPDAKGLHDLHTLLSRVGVETPAVDLLTVDGDADSNAARRLGGDEVLDETAKDRYRDRLTQLDEEIERSLDRHDDGRAAELDRERDALLEELRRAAGLGGRDRRLGDEAERSRKTVTARIRDTLRRLDERHPELAEHLRVSISTGTACRYQPGTDIAWEL